MVHCIGSVGVSLHHYSILIYIINLYLCIWAKETHVHIIRVKLMRCHASYLMTYFTSNRFFPPYEIEDTNEDDRLCVCVCVIDDDAWISIVYPWRAMQKQYNHHRIIAMFRWRNTIIRRPPHVLCECVNCECCGQTDHIRVNCVWLSLPNTNAWWPKWANHS